MIADNADDPNIDESHLKACLEGLSKAILRFGDHLSYTDIEQEWGLTVEQIIQLQLYLEANKLLIDCLRLAYVSDRAEIENSLLLPPQK
jgi:hypothetical protein